MFYSGYDDMPQYLNQARPVLPYANDDALTALSTRLLLELQQNLGSGSGR